MNPGKAIHYTLANNATVSGIVGTSVFQMGEVPQGTDAPYIVITKISDVPYSTKDGNSLMNARIQVDCYSETHNASNDLSVACMNALDRITPGNINGIAIVQVDFMNENILNEYFTAFDGLNRFSADYQVVYLRGDS